MMATSSSQESDIEGGEPEAKDSEPEAKDSEPEAKGSEPEIDLPQDVQQVINPLCPCVLTTCMMHVEWFSASDKPV
jgi:hypothetical protein